MRMHMCLLYARVLVALLGCRVVTREVGGAKRLDKESHAGISSTAFRVVDDNNDDTATTAAAAGAAAAWLGLAGVVSSHTYGKFLENSWCEFTCAYTMRNLLRATHETAGISVSVFVELELVKYYAFGVARDCAPEHV